MRAIQILNQLKDFELQDHLSKQKIEFEKRWLLKSKAHEIEMKMEINKRKIIEKSLAAKPVFINPVDMKESVFRKDYNKLSSRAKRNRKQSIREQLNNAMKILTPMGLTLGITSLFVNNKKLFSTLLIN